MESKSKMAIPQDWSNLSDKEVSEYIAYLTKRLGKYKITKDENGVIHIGDIVGVSYGVIRGQGSVVRINNRVISLGKNEPLYDNAYELYRELKDRLVPFKTKAKEWWGYHGTDVKLLALIVTLLGGLCFLCKKVYEQDKREKEQFKQEIIKEVLKRVEQEQKTLHLQQKVK